MPAQNSKSSIHVDSTTGDINDSMDMQDDSTSEHSIETEVEVKESPDDKVIDTEFEDNAVTCFRLFVFFVLLGAIIASGVCTWHLMTDEQSRDFVDQFELVADAIYQGYSEQVASITADCKTLVAVITSLSMGFNSTYWPLFYNSNFHVLGTNFRASSSANAVALAPFLHLGDKKTWETFSVANQDWIVDGLAWDGVALSNHVDSIPSMMYKHGSDGRFTTDVGDGPFAPMWEISPAPRDSSVVNYDTLSHPILSKSFEILQKTGDPVLSDLIADADLFGSTAFDTNEPVSVLVYPVKDNFTLHGKLVAMLMGSFSWKSFFSMSLHDYGMLSVSVVADNKCNHNFTFVLTQNGTTFQGYGDNHEQRFDQFRKLYDFAPFLKTYIGNEGLDCAWTISMYPTSDFYNVIYDDRPVRITTVVVSIFLGMAIIFGLYDCAVHSRQRRILAIAAQSERILSILYPKQIRDRLFGSSEEDHGKKSGKETKKMSSKNPSKSAKYQLKEFMDEDGVGRKSLTKGATESFDDKPIADLFPHTTVMFADIAGFTAWSSVREPSQVFTLLETVYRAFDNIAKRRRVFKVETVGDCYVAVTGLPEPRRDHAIAMGRFARECIQRFNDLVSQLETTLGPDTGDLALRVGLHSGPVTAGVLRGDKSRFQLFGDTVNTAARIESTGKRNKVHISMETAELIQLAGKGHWVKRREEEVEAKGKGKLQTFWLLLKEETTTSGSSTGELSSCDTAGLDEELQHVEQLAAVNATPVPQEITRRRYLMASCADDVELPIRIERLIKWNVDVLVRLLKQIVSKRNAMGRPQNNEMSLTTAEGEIRQKFMVLDEVVDIIPLPGFDPQIYKRQEDPNSIELPSEVVEQMRLYVTMIAVMYRENSFHNFEHASHVMMSVSKLLSRITAADDLWNVSEDAAKSKDFGFSLHDHTYGITSDPMTQFSVVLAALIHDVDHLGVSNFQLIKEEHQLAKLFKNKSVAEQNSVVLAWDTLMDPRFHQLRRTIYADTFELERFRQLVANTVLATDIFDQELSAKRKKRWEAAFTFRPPESVSTKEDINRKATIVIEHLIQASDVAHTMQHWHIYRKWNERLFTEMLVAYQNGKMEKNPAEFWYLGELGFFDNYVIPLAKKLKDCGVFGVSSDEYLNYALENRREWANMGEEILKNLMEKFEIETSNGRSLSSLDFVS